MAATDSGHEPAALDRDSAVRLGAEHTAWLERQLDCLRASRIVLGDHVLALRVLAEAGEPGPR